MDPMGNALQAQTLCLILDLTLRAHNLVKALRYFHGTASSVLRAPWATYTIGLV